MQFTATKDFFCAETQSQYVKGLSYTARPASDYTDKAAKDRCDTLAKLVPKWINEGKVTAGAPAGGQVKGGLHGGYS